MPISYRIDQARHLVLTTATGILADNDVLDLKRRLVADPAFRPDMRQLSDVRGITALQVTAAGVRGMVALDSANASRLEGHRLAIVTGEDVVFGMARMYQSMTEQNLPGVGVFRDYDAAAAWLGVTLESPQA